MFTTSEWVRVRQTDTGTELSVLRSMAAATPNAYDVLDEPAVDSGNNPLPPKSAAEVAEQKKSASRQAANPGHEADTKKEN